MKKLIAGNWKMNGRAADAVALARNIAGSWTDNGRCDLLVCPPFVHIAATAPVLEGTPVLLGGQDCASTIDGAYTGDISAAMLSDCGCGYVILGHSERRQYHAEPDDVIAKKAGLAHEQGLTAIICVGETDAQRSEGKAQNVVQTQLKGSIPASAMASNTVIAYEPVWAIGTGKTATPEDVMAMHAFIRKTLQEKLADFLHMRILYGGSVKPDNAAALLAVENVDGALVGGASLKADQFLAIAAAA